VSSVEPGLVLQGVSKVFFPKTANEVVALDGIDLEVEPGDFVTMIGSNGAGKSTLLNAIAGSFPLSSGVIRLKGADLTKMSEYARARMIGRVFQDPRAGTAPSMTIEENLAMALLRSQRRGLRWGVTSARRRRIRELLSLLGMSLEDRLSAPVAKLSGGQRQALALVMATAACPGLLLLDEHTAALDPKVAQTINELTASIVSEQSLTTVMVTHNMEMALRWGNRLLMMHQGRVVFDVRDEDKRVLTVGDLVNKFHDAAGESLVVDRMLLE
jgi:putative tryptophan/tyrosine transport system ATP-binding protein